MHGISDTALNPDNGNSQVLLCTKSRIKQFEGSDSERRLEAIALIISKGICTGPALQFSLDHMPHTFGVKESLWVWHLECSQLPVAPIHWQNLTCDI